MAPCACSGEKKAPTSFSHRDGWQAKRNTARGFVDDLCMRLTCEVDALIIPAPFGSTKRNTVQIRGGPAAVSGDEYCKVARPATDGDNLVGKVQKLG